MLGDISTFLGIIAISFIPIVLWGYLFAYIDEKPLSNVRFFAGVFGGILAVTPILYIDQIANIVNINYLNTFNFLDGNLEIFSAFEIGGSLSLFIIFIALFSLLSIVIFHTWISISKTYFRSIGLALVFIIGLVGLFLGIHGLFSFFPSLNISSNNPVGSIVGSSLKFIIFYYIIVGFVEEISKHFNFIPSSVIYIDNYRTGILYSIFVALGFSFTENILYFYNVYSHGGLSDDFLKLYFFRSVFAIMVHVLASSVIAYYFSKAYLLYKDKNINFPYMALFLWGLFWGVLLHGVFDIALTLGFSFVIILYFVGGYFYVTSLLYRE